MVEFIVLIFMEVLYHFKILVTLYELRSLYLGLNFYMPTTLCMQQQIMKGKVMNLKLKNNGYMKYYGGKKVRGNDIIVI